MLFLAAGDVFSLDRGLLMGDPRPMVPSLA